MSSEAFSMTSVSLTHSPVSGSSNRLRLRNERSGATARYSGSSSMSVSPPTSAMRFRLASRNLCSCSVAWTMKSVRSRAASEASSPSRSLRLIAMDRLPSAVVLEIGAESLAQEHGVMALEQPLAGAVPESPRRLVGLEPIERPVIGQLEQDHVVEVPAMRHVVPAEEPYSELRLVIPDLPREKRLHEELEERVTAAADGEERREDGHGQADLSARAGDARLFSHARIGPRLAPLRLRRRFRTARIQRVATAVADPILDLADRRGPAAQRTSASLPPVCGDEAEQEDDGLAGDQEERDRHEEEQGAEPVRPAPEHRDRRQDDEDREQAHLEAEATEPRSALRIEGLARVLNRSNRGLAVRGGHAGTIWETDASRARTRVVGASRVGAVEPATATRRM